MKKITEQENKQLIEESKKEAEKVINEGGKAVYTVTREKDKITTEYKLEPVNGEPTSSTIVQTKDEIVVNS